MTASVPRLRDDARAIWQAGVDAVDARRLVLGALRVEAGDLVVAGHRRPLDRIGRIAVVGAGKAGAAMAEAVEERLGDRVEGWVNVPDESVRPLRRIRLHGARATHENEPTEAGVTGARRVREIAESLGPEDVLLCLVSGGASALLPAPVPGVSLEEKVALTRLLHAAGATIGELNAVRKHLSELKGGGLARASRAGRVVTLAISDVVGDALDVIGSGPTAPDPTTYADALDVLARRGLLGGAAPASAVRHLTDGAAGRHEETLKTLPPHVSNHVIGGNATAVAASARAAARRGFRVVDLGSSVEGDTEEAGTWLADLAAEIRDRGSPLPPPVCVVSGGETTVRLGDRPGRGGRNQQLVLAALVRLGAAGLRDVALLSGGTDGEDGPTDVAGGVADEDLAREAERRGLDPADALRRRDAHPFLARTGGHLRTGLTGTNVMDLRVLLVAAPADAPAPPG